jgi:hypothetical membrane protein
MSDRTLCRLALVLLAAELLVAALIGSAMAAYPASYSWSKHFLSAMGLTRLRDGTPNGWSFFLFNGALLLAGVASALYFAARSRAGGHPALRFAMAGVGVVAGLALAAIGMTPYDLLPETHNCCTYVASGFGVAIMLAALQPTGRFGSAAENSIWAACGVFVLLLWAALRYLAVTGQLPRTPTFQFMQKMLVGFFFLYMLWQTAALYRRTRRRGADR